MIYIFEFDIVPGKADPFWAFMESTGAPFWLQFDSVKQYEVFSRLGGSPGYEGHVVIDSLAAFEKIRTHPDWGNVAKGTAEYVMNTQRRFILEEKVFAKR